MRGRISLQLRFDASPCVASQRACYSCSKEFIHALVTHGAVILSCKCRSHVCKVSQGEMMGLSSCYKYKYDYLRTPIQAFHFRPRRRGVVCVSGGKDENKQSALCNRNGSKALTDLWRFRTYTDSPATIGFFLRKSPAYVAFTRQARIYR